MSLLSRIEYQSGFSELEKKIADYLIEHKEDVIHMNLKELAKATYTSTATISRFCKKVGEKNFNDFRVHFAEVTQSQSFATVNFNRPFLPDSSVGEIQYNISDIYKQTIDGTNLVLDLNELNRAVDCIEQTNIIDIFGFGDSYLTAQLFEHKMTYVNKYVNLKAIPTEQNQQALYTNKDTVAIVISYSGETNELIKIAKILKEKKTPIIVLTSIGDNRLSHYANYILNIGSREKIFTKIAPFASQTSIEYILNVIFSCLFKKDYQTNIQNKISYDKENDVRHPLHSPVNDIIE